MAKRNGGISNNRDWNGDFPLCRHFSSGPFKKIGITIRRRANTPTFHEIAIRLFYLAILLNLIAGATFSQKAQLPPGFEQIMNKDGLSQGFITCIFQDSRGFMWFGTKDGLNRYDGIGFRVFRHDPFDATTLSNNYINDIYEDHLGNMWIGTNNGLNRFDPKQETVIRFYHDAENPGSLSHSKIDIITEYVPSPAAETVTLWLGTRKGLNLLEIRPGAIENKATDKGMTSNKKLQWRNTRFYHDPQDTLSLPGNYIKDAWVDRSGMLWVLTLKGVVTTEARGAVPGFQHLFTKQHDLLNLPSQAYIKIREGKDGSIWMTSFKELTRIRPDGRISNYHLPAIKIFPEDTSPFVTSILVDPAEQVWLTLYNGKSLIFDSHRERFQTFEEKFDIPSGILKKQKQFFLDRGGVMWIGTNGFGLLKYDRKKERFHTVSKRHVVSNPPASSFVGKLFPGNTGSAVVGLGGKYFRHDPVHNTLIPYHVFKKSGHFQNMILGADSKTLYIKKGAKISYYHPEQHKIVQIFPDLQHQSRTWRMHPVLLADRNGNICFVAKEKKNVPVAAPWNYNTFYRWHTQTGSLSATELTLSEELTVLRKDFEIYSGVQGQLNRYWLSSNIGLIKVNTETGDTKVYRNDPENRQSLNNNHVKSLCPDPLSPDRYLWIGTDGGGINRFDMQNETARHFTKADGLPNHVVYGILADNRNNLWLSTNNGLSNAILDKKSREITAFRNYSFQDGLQGDEFNTGAYFKNTQGLMYFGGINGFNWFHPDNIWDNPHVPPIVITGLRLNNRPVSHKDAGSPLPGHISTVETLVLPYYENIITLEFVALDYSIPEKNQYSYRLENFNRHWSAPDVDNKAVYTNLSPGEYIFRVKGSNNDDVWNEAGASLKIIITPPWWQTWWAYLIYTLTIIGLIVFLIRYRERALRQRTEELEGVVAERTVQLAQQNTRLQELDSLKSRFFANISHEFRTPLTLILGPVDQMIEMARDSKFEEKLDTVQRNARRLLNQINELLDLAKLESGKMTLQASPGDFTAFLKGIVSAFSSMADLQDIDLRFREREPMPEPTMYFDHGKMEKIFANILANAFKFTPNGGAIIVEILSFKSKIAEVRISDTGPGIPPEDLPYIFDRFYQARDESAASQGRIGTGIGMALTRELVELHHGSISVESEVGKGATFIVRLPLGTAHLQEAEIVERETKRIKRSKKSEIETTKGAKIENQDINPKSGIKKSEIRNPTCPVGESEIVLLVEDNPDMRAYIREELLKNYQLVEAVNGRKGFEKAVEIIPDLVISDVMMPEMDGYQLCEKLKTDERTSHIPVILLTAKAGDESKVEGLETGADDYLTKPFDFRELHIRVKNLVEQRRKLRERFSGEVLLKPGDIAVTSIDQQFLEKALAVIEENMENESFGVDDLSDAIGIGRRQLSRKLRALINQSPAKFILSTRLHRAAELIKQNAGTIAEIAYITGFNTPNYFTTLFGKQFGCTPKEYREKH